LTVPAATLRLWWPHTLLAESRGGSDGSDGSDNRDNSDDSGGGGEYAGAGMRPHLYTAHFAATELPHDGVRESGGSGNIRASDGSTIDSGSRSLLSPLARARLSVLVGVRTVESWFDPVTQGRAFAVNGVKVYLEGGNWIATDLLLRFAAHADRYMEEVSLHAAMGFNLIRVWGGGLVETRAFYDACDTLGVLVYQELQMTGDNNGRWGGSYDWPLNQPAYLRNADDTFRRLRGHPSLLLVGGGNELSPQALSPPPSVALGLDALARQWLPPGVTYIASSMAPQNYSAPFDWTYAMAPNDGNYGLNLLGTYWTDRNPGLAGAEDVPIAFQPEIGNAAAPLSRRGLARFLSSSALDALPRPGATAESVHPAWVYHKYLGMTTTVLAASAAGASPPVPSSSEAAARCARVAAGQAGAATTVYDHTYAYGPADPAAASADSG
jgi:hypothetical protein